jgi:DNA-binding NarL/FixJ family response regulator
MIQGLTTREMAVEMYVAVGTVRSHVSALLGKLGVRSRAEAVALMDRR